MRYDIQKILLSHSKRRQLQDGYMVLRNQHLSTKTVYLTGSWIATPTSCSRVNMEMVKIASPWQYPKFHYLVGKRARLDPILNQLKLARTILFKAHLCMRLPTGCFPFRSSYQNCTCISSLNDSLPSQNLSCFYTNFEAPRYAIVSIPLYLQYSQHPVLQHLQFTFFQLHY